MYNDDGYHYESCTISYAPLSVDSLLGPTLIYANTGEKCSAVHDVTYLARQMRHPNLRTYQAWEVVARIGTMADNEEEKIVQLYQLCSEAKAMQMVAYFQEEADEMLFIEAKREALTLPSEIIKVTYDDGEKDIVFRALPAQQREPYIFKTPFLYQNDTVIFNCDVLRDKAELLGRNLDKVDAGTLHRSLQQLDRVTGFISLPATIKIMADPREIGPRDAACSIEPGRKICALQESNVINLLVSGQDKVIFQAMENLTEAFLLPYIDQFSEYAPLRNSTAFHYDDQKKLLQNLDKSAFYLRN